MFLYKYIWRVTSPYKPRPHNGHQREKQWRANKGGKAEERRTRCHGNQSLSSSSSTFPRSSLLLRPWSSSANVLTTGCIPPLPRDPTLLCLFPKRPMGLTPRPTYQNGSISGPGHHTSTSEENRLLWLNNFVVLRQKELQNSDFFYRKPQRWVQTVRKQLKPCSFSLIGSFFFSVCIDACLLCFLPKMFFWSFMQLIFLSQPNENKMNWSNINF